MKNMKRKKNVPYAKPELFRELFAKLWHDLFTTHIHLDSAVSKAPPSMKAPLAEVTRLFLQRPRSLAKFLQFRLSDREPWKLSQEELAEWDTGCEMAYRLFQTWRRDPYFYEEGFALPDDYPAWLLEEIRRDFGAKISDELVRSLAKPPPLSLRAKRNPGRNKVLSDLNDSEELPIRGKASLHAPFGFYFPEYVQVRNHDLGRKGFYEIQDEGSQIMSLFALWPETFLPLLRKFPGEARPWGKDHEVPTQKKPIVVVDVCAGAGGKTLAMADALGGRSQIFAYDCSASKLQALRLRARRLGYNNIKTKTVEEDPTQLDLTSFAKKADVVLIDSPCSGWGVLRRNPDIKWRQDKESRARLEILQAKLLDTYSALVKPGGQLVYGVCTFRKKETSLQISHFLEQHKEFTSIGGGYYGPNPSDGFYFHAMRRTL